ncbi:MAG: Lsr2 family protein [Ilumatobacteraceae bacterium]
MAREVIERLIDDLDGGDAAETVTFGLDGVTYEIDVNKKNAAALRKSLARYVKAARRSSSAPARSARRKAAPSPNGSKPKRDYDIVQLREWAGANNVAVPSRGRIPQAVVRQYKQAGGF